MILFIAYDTDVIVGFKYRILLYIAIVKCHYIYHIYIFMLCVKTYRIDRSIYTHKRILILPLYWRHVRVVHTRAPHTSTHTHIHTHTHTRTRTRTHTHWYTHIKIAFSCGVNILWCVYTFSCAYYVFLCVYTREYCHSHCAGGMFVWCQYFLVLSIFSLCIYMFSCAYIQESIAEGMFEY